MGQGHSGLLLLGKPVPAPSRAALTLEVHVAPFLLPFSFMKMFTRSLCHLGLLFLRTEAVAESRETGFHPQLVVAQSLRYLFGGPIPGTPSRA